MKIYCIRFANSHIFRILESILGSGAGSEDSISSRPRFREPIFELILCSDRLPPIQASMEAEIASNQKKMFQDYVVISKVEFQM